MTTIKVCQFHIHELCNDLTMSFHSNAFKDFKDLELCKHENTNLKWKASSLDLNTLDLECFVFECANMIIHANYHDLMTSMLGLICEKAFNIIVGDGKKTCKGAPYFYLMSFLSLCFIFYSLNFCFEILLMVLVCCCVGQG